MFYKRALLVRRQLEKQIETLQIKLNELPSGKLICSHNGKYVKWYISDEKNHIYLPKQERNLAKQLAIKKYYSLQLESLSQEKKAVESYIKKHESHSFQKENNLFQIPGYRELILEQFNPNSNELSDWQATPYEKNPSHPEKLIYQTCAGNFVRSKSEVIITEALLRNKIPFRYECALQLKRKVIYPDFTIRHPETGEIFYWEHFGMIDDLEYGKSACSKIQMYISNEIYPSIQLITTFETQDSPLDSYMVEKIIQYYFGHGEEEICRMDSKLDIR